MSRMTAATIVGATILLAGGPVGAQTKVIPGEHKRITATVEAIETGTRTVTLRRSTGELTTVRVPDQAARFSEIRVGDTVSITYYDNIVLRVKAPSEQDVDTVHAALTPGTGGRPAGTSAYQQTISATVDAIDVNTPSISFKGPRDWSYSAKVQDRNALQQVKVGTRVDITWTEATLVSVAPAKK